MSTETPTTETTEVVLVSESNLDDPCCFRRDEVWRGPFAEATAPLRRWEFRFRSIGSRLVLFRADEVQPALENGHVRLVSEGPVR
jgi:hypothetical protein